MAQMTEKDLTDLICKTTLPLIKANVEKDVGELVEQNVRKAVDGRSNTPPEWVSRMFGDQRQAPVAREKGTGFAACIRALTAGKQDPIRAVANLKAWGYSDIAEAMEKSMTAGTPTAGGYLVPPAYSTEIIELLKPASVIRRMGAMVVPMPSGTMSWPKVTTGTTGYYVGEASNITPSQLVVGQMKLSFKKLAVLVPLSNDLLRFSSPAADSVVRDDAVRGIAATENAYFIRSNGASGPKGLRYQVSDANLIHGLATVSLANVTTDLGKMVGKLMAADVPFTRAGWIMSPRTYIYLSTILTTNGTFAFRDELIAGRLWGWPYAVTTSIPENIAGDTGTLNTSELYLADFADVVIGESMNLVVDASSEAAYYDGSNVVAAFSRDETVIRIIEEHDLGVRRDKSVAVLYGITWGA